MRKEVIVHKNPKSPISEIFRTLRTNIQFMDINKKMKMMLVTSTFAGEGKSWVTANIATTFAQTGKKVLIIDADMRKGRQYAIFGVAPRPGLSNYLSSTEFDDKGQATESLQEYIQETEVNNLFIITSGNVPPNPAELIGSAQMVNLIENLKTVFDIIIFDGTPCELVADSIILSRLVDSTIIVTAYKKTKKDSLDRCIKNIQNVGGKIAGVILNKMPIKGKEYGEKYYYYGKKSIPTKKNVIKKMNDFNKRVDTNVMNLQNEINEKRDVKENNNSKAEIQLTSKPETSITNNDNFLGKTNEILKQINEYIDKEKNNLK